MLARLLLPMRITLVALACACGLASSPGPPTKATTAQIDQMNQEIGAGSGEAAPNWAALAKAIRDAANSVDRLHWISEFAHHTAALPESLRTQRLAELRQLMREVR